MVVDYGPGPSSSTKYVTVDFSLELERLERDGVRWVWAVLDLQNKPLVRFGSGRGPSMLKLDI